MKTVLYTIVLLTLSALQTKGQTTPSWAWARTDTSYGHLSGPTATHTLVASGSKTVLWAYPTSKGILYGSDLMGNYKFTEYDTAGTVLQSAVVNGKVYFIDAQADTAGNWYLLGRYYDTVQFASGLTLTRNSGGSESDYFIMRLNAGTLSLAWVQHAGVDYQSSLAVFTIKNNALYLPIDSGGIATNVYKLNLNTGARSLLLTQTGHSYTSSIQVDERENVYIAGSCAFSSMNFNGHTVTGTSSYPAFLVRYKAGAQYDWVQFLTDVTCVPRKVSLVTNNLIYYTGPLNDSLTFGGVHLHRPNWVYGILLSRLDSLGNVLWVQQLRDSLLGDADLQYGYHACVNPDSTLNIFPETRLDIDWGNGIRTHSGSGAATVVNFSADGTALWAKAVNADYSSTAHITSNGHNILIAGYGNDSTSLQFDGISLPVSSSHYTYNPYMARLRYGTNTVLPNAVPVPAAAIQFSVSPNPASNSLLITSGTHSGSIQLRMTDLSGKEVYEASYNKTVLHESINVSRYPRGLYFIELKTGTSRSIQKIILE